MKLKKYILENKRSNEVKAVMLHIKNLEYHGLNDVECGGEICVAEKMSTRKVGRSWKVTSIFRQRRLPEHHSEDEDAQYFRYGKVQNSFAIETIYRNGRASHKSIRLIVKGKRISGALKSTDSIPISWEDFEDDYEKDKLSVCSYDD